MLHDTQELLRVLNMRPFLLHHWLVIHLFPVGFVYSWLYGTAFVIEQIVWCKVT